MTIKKIGNLLLDTSNLTAERSMTQQDRDGALADLQNIQDISDKQSFKLNGTATSYAVSQTTSALAVGTGDCTFIWRGLLNNITGTRYFLNLYDGASGIFSILHYSGLISLHNGGQVASGFTAPTGKPFSVAMKRYTSSGGKFKTYLNGIADIERSATVTDFANSTYFSVGYISGANTIDGSVFRALFFNYALSDEKITRYSNGGPIDWEDLSGSMTAITAGTPTAGKRYRITSVAGGASFTASGASANTVGVEFIANGTAPTWGSGSLIQLGVCIAYEPEGITSDKWLDYSSNRFHGTLNNALSTNKLLSEYYEGSFTAAMDTGMNITNSIAVNYSRNGKSVSLKIPNSQVTATASSTVWGTSGTPIPEDIRPSSTQVIPCIITGNTGVYLTGHCRVYSTGELFFTNFSNWGNGETLCGVPPLTITYML